MSDPTEEDHTDGLECFKFQLFLDDYITSSHKKEKSGFYSAAKSRERTRTLTNSERRGSNFENQTAEPRAPMETTFRKVYELINEQEPPDFAQPASEKKSKKGQKNLTPETNYTQKEVDLEDDALSFKSGGQKRDFNIWGSYRWSREEESHSKKTLTAYSEAYEPEHPHEPNDKSTPFVFDLDSFRLVRAPKKNSMALPEGTLDLMQSLRAAPRKLSFQQDRPLDLQKELPLRFLQPEKKVPRRFSSFVQPRMGEVFSSIGLRLEQLISENGSKEFPKLA
jgi:hypothetical protein